ncbi:MAG: hypothetical protein AAF399_01920, partial [Bacteroidota bacterium]
MSAYQLSSPPRYQSLWSRLVLLNSGGFVVFGWLIFGFGMIFFWVFFMQSEIIFWGESHEWEQTTGTVTNVISTNATEDGTLIFQILFEYEVAGTSYFSDGYSSGSNLAAGETIPVE